ncbi:hypothetical protein T03_8311 [Trichinella britovi]|uniref:Uncharacterized protein n=2 Tax=Trichinella britovi TaxID=45882 RepID=A0A0V1C4A4_TRIBR|nr:hypothetical protein T03_10498 [Trichinella britovi]KRY44173.1 hypothetical protein T03_8311 [Trichinella britovi]
MISEAKAHTTEDSCQLCQRIDDSFLVLVKSMSVRDPLSIGLVRHPNQVISAFVAKRRRAGVDWLVSLRGHLCWLPPALLLLPPSSRFPDDIIPNRRLAESIAFIINYEQRPLTIRHRILCKPTITTRSQRATHYRNPPLIFKYISSYDSFLLTYLYT